MKKGCMAIAPADSHTDSHSSSHSANRAGHESMLAIRLEATWDPVRVTDAVASPGVVHMAIEMWAMGRCWDCTAGRDWAA